PDQLGVDAEAGQIGEALLAFGVLSHALPTVRVQTVGTARRRTRVVHDLDGAARLDRGPLRGLDHVPVWLVAVRDGGDEPYAELRARRHQRRADVVSVAEVREPHAGQAPEPLAHRHQVGERLAGVGFVREPVYDRDRRVLRELFHVRLGKRADDDRVQVAGAD